MAQIQRPDLVEKLRRAFSIVTGNVGSTMSPEIVGVVIVDDVTKPGSISEAYPRLALGNTESAAAAGFNSKLGIENPVGSGVDVIIDRCILSDVGNDFLTLRRTPTPAPLRNAGTQDWVDRRNDGRPVAIPSDENATIGLGVQLLNLRAPSTGTIPIELGILLPDDGSWIFWQQAAANVGFQCSWFWTERPKIGQ